MRAVYQFFKSTILGGLVVLLPLVAVIALVAWAVGIVVKAVMPLVQRFPDTSIGGVSLALMSVIVGIVLCCFLAGLLAETALVRGLGRYAERLAYSIPGYALMKDVGANLVGIEEKKPIKTVIVRFESSFQLGFMMDTLADGRHVIFIPGVPSALVGTLHIVAKERVQLLDMTVAKALDALGRLGVGLREKWPTDQPL